MNRTASRLHGGAAGGYKRAWRTDAASQSGHFHAVVASQVVALQRTSQGLQGIAVPPMLASTQHLLVAADDHAMQAGEIARPWLEQLTGLACEIRHVRELHELPPAGTGIVLADHDRDVAAIAALRGQGLGVIAVTDDPAATAADLAWPIADGLGGRGGGSQIAVRVLALARLGLAIGVARGAVDDAAATRVGRALMEAPVVCALTCSADARFAAIGRRVAGTGGAIVIGDGWATPLAALATGLIAAPARRPGPGMLVPGIVLAGEGSGYPTGIAALRDGGRHVIGLVEARACDDLVDSVDEIVGLPGRSIGNVFAQLVALQMIAGHAALAMGLDPVPGPAGIGA